MTMAIDPQLKAQLSQTIAVAAATSTPTTSGDPTWSAAANVSARVVPKRTIMAGAGGEEIVSSYMIVVENSIGINDRIWLPGDSSADATLARQPKAVDQGVDEFGNTSHFEVYV